MYALSLSKAIKIKIERRVIAKETQNIIDLSNRNNELNKELSKENWTTTIALTKRVIVTILLKCYK